MGADVSPIAAAAAEAAVMSLYYSGGRLSDKALKLATPGADYAGILVGLCRVDSSRGDPCPKVLRESADLNVTLAESGACRDEPDDDLCRVRCRAGSATEEAFRWTLVRGVLGAIVRWDGEKSDLGIGLAPSDDRRDRCAQGCELLDRTECRFPVV